MAKINVTKFLDYKIKSREKRMEIVNHILETLPQEQLTPSLLDKISNYIITPINKKERQEKKILTNNRMITITKRETSLEGITEKMENGEDAIYHMVSQNKNYPLTQKISISEEEENEISPLKLLREEIAKIEEQKRTAPKKLKGKLQRQIIQMRQDQYVIKNTYKPPIKKQKATNTEPIYYINEKIAVTKYGQVIDNSDISLCNPDHVAAILANYSKLRGDSWGNFQNDILYLLDDLDNIAEAALKDKFPLYYDLLIYKVDGIDNYEIQGRLSAAYGVYYPIEYLSNLWTNKIPRLIADKAQEKYINWYFTNVEKATWKKCSHCGQKKLAINRYFSKNNTSKDGFYSICKECRNKKTYQKKLMKERQKQKQNELSM